MFNKKKKSPHKVCAPWGQLSLQYSEALQMKHLIASACGVVAKTQETMLVITDTHIKLSLDVQVELELFLCVGTGQGAGSNLQTTLIQNRVGVGI